MSQKNLEVKYREAKANKHLSSMYRYANELATSFMTDSDYNSASLYTDHALKHVEDLLKQHPTNTELIRKKCVQLIRMGSILITTKRSVTEVIDFVRQARDLTRDYSLHEEYYESLSILYDQYSSKDDIDNSFEILLETEKLLNLMKEKAKNGSKTKIEKDRAGMYLKFGILFTKKEIYGNADEYLQLSLQLYNDNECNYDAAHVYCAMGVSSTIQHDFEDGEILFHKALRTFQAGHRWNDVVMAFEHLYHVNYAQANNTDADTEVSCGEFFKRAEKMLVEQSKVIQEKLKNDPGLKAINDKNRNQISSALHENARQYEKIKELERETNVKKRISIIQEIMNMASGEHIKNNTMRLDMARRAQEISIGKGKVDWQNTISNILLDLILDGHDLHEEWVESYEIAMDLCAKGNFDSEPTKRTKEAYQLRKSGGKVPNPLEISLNDSQDVEIVTDPKEQLRSSLKSDATLFSKKLQDWITSLPLNKLDSTMSKTFQEKLKEKYNEFLSDLTLHEFEGNPRKRVKTEQEYHK
jgi:tetratricopeptide (TPR) repeat protein